MVGDNRLASRISRRILAIYAWAVIGFLLLPIFIVIPMSFNDAVLFEVIPSNPSVKQYARLFASPDWLEVLFRSARIAVLAMAAATVLGTLAALGIAALRARARALIEAAFIAPQIVPSVVIATAAYYVFAWLGMIGTTPAIVIAHSLLALPFVVVMVGSRLQSLSPELAQASASLGANATRTFFHVTLPQLKVAIIGGALLAFHVSFDEVVLALFLSGARNKTLPVKLWDSILFEVSPLLPAISTVVLIIPLLALAPIALWRLIARAEKRPPNTV